MHDILILTEPVELVEMHNLNARYLTAPVEGGNAKITT
jgi:hypothetical protein